MSRRCCAPISSLSAMGLRRNYATTPPLAALASIVGWTPHALDQRGAGRAAIELRRRSAQVGAGGDFVIHALLHLFWKHRGDHIVVLQTADAEPEMLERRVADQALEAFRRQALAVPKTEEAQRRRVCDRGDVAQRTSCCRSRLPRAEQARRDRAASRHAAAIATRCAGGCDQVSARKDRANY